MRVGIHKDPYGRICEFSRVYEAILTHNNIDLVWLDASRADFWELVAGLDLFILRWYQIDDHHQLAQTIIPIIERQMGIPCFPNMATCWHYDDKIRQYYLLSQAGIPVGKNWIFWDKRQALAWADTASMPVVFKLKGGASANNVILVESRAKARSLISRMFGPGIRSGHIPDKSDIRFKHFDFKKSIRLWGGNLRRFLRDEDISPYWAVHKNYALFQEFLPGNAYDIRIVIIGERAYGFRRFNRKNDFRASGSGRIDFNPALVDPAAIRLAFQISGRFGFQSMSYDILYDQTRTPLIIEMSYTYIPDVLTKCPGYWDAELNWHAGHYWPQYFHLVDMLKRPDLRQPEIPTSPLYKNYGR